MRKKDHMIGSNNREIHPDFDKTVHNLCPRCRNQDLTVYFNSGSARKVGVLCYTCGLVGFFARNEFFQIVQLPENRLA